MRTGALIAVAACGGPAPETGGPADSRGGTDFTDTLDPDSVHVLATALPPVAADGHALHELGADFSPRWSHDAETGGSMGGTRLPDGSTVYARSGLPPDLASAIELVGADGELAWSYSELFSSGLGFSHGVVATPDGDFIAADTMAGTLFSFESGGATLWTMNLGTGAEAGTPNGIDLVEATDGRVLLAVSLLRRYSESAGDRLVLMELGARDVGPTILWRRDLETDEGGAAWPHGPHFQSDGTLTVCLSSLRTIAGYDLDGNRTFGIEADRLVFPRDAAFLPDGTLVVVDGATELLRIADPFGAFAVAAAVPVSGVFSAELVECGPAGGLPCITP